MVSLFFGISVHQRKSAAKNFLLLTAREQQRDKSREQLDKMMQELTLDETT